jgi:hypothetical protein
MIRCLMMPSTLISPELFINFELPRLPTC